ncbi:hypothetical protein FPV67DRAFT_1038537 [Lyophyllum atratum]|nr:hypothetical protein FPV67DRAFT_1038537 [Lyophyllum atratum]
MFHSSLMMILVACAGLAAISSVNAFPMVDASNSTQTLSTHASFSDNPFEGIMIDIRSDSFSKSMVDRSAMDAELDRRIIGAIVRGAVQLIMKVVAKVKEGIEKDKKARGKYTMWVAEEGRKQHPEFNWVVCHTKHRTKWKGTKGVDWGHDHKEFDVKIGGTIGYEVYYAREGEFWNNGDGGYLNWAYSGFFKADGKGNKHVMFTRPPGK